MEITESGLIENLASASQVVSGLKALGCKLAIDDFGTGYSSLQHLHALPFEELKIDRSFVTSIAKKRDSRKIVSAIVGLGQSLGMTTVAEGIATQEEAEMMLWLGCDFGQGYFFGRPMPASDLAASVSRPREKLVARTFSAWNSISEANQDLSPSQRLAQLQAVYDAVPVGLAFIDQNLRYVNINKKLAAMNGIPAEAHLGATLAEVLPEYYAGVEPYITRALSGEAICDVEAGFPGTEQKRLLSYQPAFRETGEVVGIAIAIADITERKRVEEALKVSEAHYRNMVELNPQVLWVMDPQGRNLNISPRWDKSTGSLQSTSNDHEWLRSLHPEDLRPTMNAVTASRQSGSPIHVEYRTGSAEAGWRWKRALGAPRFNVNGDIVCWYGSVQDIEEPSKPIEGVIRNGRFKPVDAAAKIIHRSSEARRSRQVARHQALLDLDIMDTPAESEYDDLVILASEICGVPMSTISLLDEERQWFKASVGMPASESPLSMSFCAHAVEQRGLFVVGDAALDDRFKANPLVLGEPHIRFYAGMPLYVDQDIAVGTLCVLDTVPRTLSPGQAKALTILSHQVQARLELRSEKRKLQTLTAAAQTQGAWPFDGLGDRYQ